ncbi:MAG: M48 family metallopeptidase [Proteobacteria bacterium]|nr:M48 family metallopeptidase [Pseudomonadota bacterium]
MHLLKNEHGILTGLQIDEVYITIEIRQKLGIKRLSLRFDQARTCLRVSVGKYHFSKIEDFIYQSEEWIRKGVKKLKPHLLIKPGEEIHIFGEKYILEIQKGFEGLVFKEKRMIVSCPSPRNFQKVLEAHLKKEAIRFFYDLSFLYASRLGTRPLEIKVRDFKSRWGSCSHNGILSYSWRLIFAPKEIAEYVCAHEVSHLKEMNHSDSFWTLVKELCPFYKVYRAWLRKEGSSLFRIQWDQGGSF